MLLDTIELTSVKSTSNIYLKYFCLQETVDTEELTQTTASQFIAVAGDILEPVDIAILIEQCIVLEEISSFAEATALFLALDYLLDLQYPNIPKTERQVMFFEVVHNELLQLTV